MNSRSPMPPRRSQNGFVLVTSLIFLVVITLLAVSAINSSTLQERMASNQREKSRARQAADAALRRGELVLQDAVFDTLQKPGSTVIVDTPADTDNAGGTLSVRIWRRGEMIEETDQQDNPEAFLDDTTWASGKPLNYTLDDLLAPVDYFVEDYDCIARDLNPDSEAVCDGSMLYRVTARARGQNPAAVAVTQSIYEKNY
ncbi:Type 4 fimbrial biosis protein PilX [Salinisphaera shabanensis E1L3A]|uniref:Type 4 fimbrial biosis protein PilX n=1 Tax=Salinisphaera shabanensis E1L3A TaxID=1033802 RepID=U2EHN7_9GAMM|nr:Type 4 fimbrial biosis protein PilX [Salinisphaera shabanensis E1L3A]